MYRNKNMSGQCKEEGGYSLVEVLITIVIISILFVAVLALFSNVSIIQGRTHNQETATRAAHQQVESLRNLQYNSLTEGDDIDFSEDLPDRLPDGSSGIVTITEAGEGLKKVDVTVSYPEGSGVQEVVVSSLIGIIGITQ